jgi:3-dehydroquinate synthetase
MGKRHFSHLLLNPTTRVEYLQEEYNITEKLLGIEGVDQYKVVKTMLVHIKDISKINTTIFLKILKKDKKNIKNNFWFVLSKGIGKMFLKEFKSEKKVLMLIKKYLVHANK